MGRHRELAADVRSTLATFQNLTATHAIANPEAFAKARLALVQAVNGYIGHLGACVERLGNSPCRRQWAAEHARVVDLRRSYSEHIARFSAVTAGKDWPAYRASSERLMASMRRHLDQVMGWAPIH